MAKHDYKINTLSWLDFFDVVAPPALSYRNGNAKRQMYHHRSFMPVAPPNGLDCLFWSWILVTRSSQQSKRIRSLDALPLPRLQLLVQHCHCNGVRAFRHGVRRSNGQPRQGSAGNVFLQVIKFSGSGFAVSVDAICSQMREPSLWSLRTEKPIAWKESTGSPKDFWTPLEMGGQLSSRHGTQFVTRHLPKGARYWKLFFFGFRGRPQI